MVFSPFFGNLFKGHSGFLSRLVTGEFPQRDTRERRLFSGMLSFIIYNLVRISYFFPSLQVSKLKFDGFYPRVMLSRFQCVTRSEVNIILKTDIML